MEGMVRIAIEAFGINNPGGGRSSILNLLNHIFSSDHENFYKIYLSQYETSLASFPNIQQVIAPVKNRFMVRLWAQSVFPFQLKGFDLVHFTKNLGVFGLTMPYVVTIHDLTILNFPKFYPKSDYWYFRTIEGLTVRSAARIIAVSHNTSDDIIKFYGQSPSRIRVIYNGISEIFHPAILQEIQRIRDKYSLPADYIITVGRIDIKKNLTTLVRAFARLKRETDYGGKLVLVGEVYRKCEDKNLLPTIRLMGLENEVIMTGRVPDDDLPGLYSGAAACAFPSLHEGFGLVGLEAMACGVPLITHNVSGITEIVKDAGLMVDASDDQKLMVALKLVIDHQELKGSMRMAGIKKSAEFSGQKAAEMTLQIYKEVVGKDR